VREHHFEPAKGLPGLLPAGEKVLWQGAPEWRALLSGAFMGRGVALWFIAIMGWRFGGGLAEGDGLATSAMYAAWTLPVMAAAFAVLSVLAWATARATVYTITSRRVVIRLGVAISMSVNLPFRKVTAVSLRSLPGGRGDIPLSLGGSERLSWVMLWPHARPWRLARPEPMLRAVPDAARVAALLADAVAAFQAEHGLDIGTDAAASPARTRPAKTAERPTGGMVAAE
jgi:hypothetical protein